MHRKNKKKIGLMGEQYDITISLKTIKTTTKTGKNHTFSRKMREEIVEAI